MDSTPTAGEPGSATRRLRIGALTSFLGDPQGQDLWRGLRQKAKQHDVDLIGISINHLIADLDSDDGRTLIDFLSAIRLDGLLLTFKTLFHTDAPGRQCLADRLRPLPVVSVASDCPATCPSPRTGMRVWARPSTI
jgi:hypothetical protein